MLSNILLFTLLSIGTVYPCIDEQSNPNLTCFNAGGQRWGIEENFDRPIGNEVDVLFTFIKRDFDEAEDVFEMQEVRILN